MKRATNDAVLEPQRRGRVEGSHDQYSCRASFFYRVRSTRRLWRPIVTITFATGSNRVHCSIVTDSSRVHCSGGFCVRSDCTSRCEVRKCGPASCRLHTGGTCLLRYRGTLLRESWSGVLQAERSVRREHLSAVDPGDGIEPSLAASKAAPSPREPGVARDGIEPSPPPYESGPPPRSARGSRGWELNPLRRKATGYEPVEKAVSRSLQCPRMESNHRVTASEAARCVPQRGHQTQSILCALANPESVSYGFDMPVVRPDYTPLSRGDIEKRLHELKAFFGTMVRWTFGGDLATVYVIASTATDSASFAFPLEDAHQCHLSLAAIESRLYAMTGKGKSYPNPRE